MGNEMGNSNVSGLQEEENRTVETSEKSLQEAGYADNVKEENQIVPAVEDKDFHEKVAGLASGEGNHIVPAVEDTNFHEKITGLESGEGNQIAPAVEDTNFHEKITGLASGEGNQIVPAVEDTIFQEKITGLASGEGNQIVPAVEDIDFHENLTAFAADEGNQTVPAIEDKDIHEKVTGLVSDDPHGAGNLCIDDQTSDGIEQYDSNVQPPPGSPQVVIESKDGNADSRIQPASLSADDYNDETLIKSNLEDKLSETSEKQIERQTSLEKEKEETTSSSSTNSAPNSPEHLEYVDSDFDQHELDKIHADPSVENHSELMQESEEILGLRLSCDSSEKGHLDAEIAHTLAESVCSDTNPEVEKKGEEMASTEDEVSDTSICEGNAEIRDGDEVPNGLNKTSTGSGNNSDGGFPTEMNLIRNGSLDIQQEAIKANNSDAGLPVELKLIRNGSLDIEQEAIKANNSDAGLPVEMKLIRNGSLDIQQEAMENKGDGGLPVEMNLIQMSSSDLQPEAIPLSDSLNSFQEVAKPEVKCVVLTEDTKLIGLGLVNKDEMHDLCPTQFPEELVNASKTNKSDSSHSDHGNHGKEGVMDTSCSSAMDKEFQVEEAKVLENDFKVHLCESSPNSTLEELCKNPDEGTAKLSKMDAVPTELIVIDCNQEGEEPTEKNMVEEILEKTEYSYAMGNDIEERKTTEQSVFQSHPTGEAVSLLPPPPAFPMQSQEHKPDAVIEIFESRNHSPLVIQQHGSGEFSLIKVSNLDASDLTMETLVFAVGVASNKPGQELPQSPKTTSIAVSQFETADQSNEKCGKDQTPALPSGGYEAKEGVERVSTESNPESLAIQDGMRKSPSFHFELLAEASTEDSDQTPLLYHDKTVTGSLSRGVDVNFRNPVGEYGQDSVRCQAMPVEEDSLKLEKSDSEKSRTPFLSFLKEEEEARLVVSQKSQDTVVPEKKAAKEVWNSTSPKRAKRRSKSSLFSNCICCATAIS